MAPDPKCVAIAGALHKSGMDYKQLANKVGSTEKRVTDICVGNEKPTEAEFKSLASALSLTDNVEHTGKHATQ